MSLSPSFLDQLRARTTLSALIGRTVKVEKAGREHKACCPFHSEKTPSFTINDEKGFYHCFGCGAHGDAIRWLGEHRGLPFMEAVRELADAAGMEVPAATPEQARRQEKVASAGEVLARVAAWYAAQLEKAPGVLQWLLDRGVSIEQARAFGLGYAPGRVSVAACGVPADALRASGLLVEIEEGPRAGALRDHFRHRLIVPIRDHRGRVAGFGGRALPGADGVEGKPKYVNSVQSDMFDKGRLLYNLDRAAPAARLARRLVVVEGYFDAIALDAAEIAETVAPMGTALTEAQLELAWRAHYRPTLLFDGDEAGRKAAVRACERALPLVGPLRELAVGLLPAGVDPDDLARREGRDGIEAVLASARPMVDFLWDAMLADLPEIVTPEARSGLRRRFEALAGAIGDEETRAGYLGAWRTGFAAAFPPPPPGLSEEDMLPNGSVEALSSMAEVVRARLERVSAAWLERSEARLAPVAKDVGRWAWELGRRVAYGLIPVEAAQGPFDRAVAALVEADAAAGRTDASEDIARSFAAGERKGFDPAPLLLDMRCAGFQRTDLGNAERWHARYGRDYLYTTAKGWLGWDGRRYRVLTQEKDATPAEVLASVFATMRAIQDESRFVRETGQPEENFPTDELLLTMAPTDGQVGAMDARIMAGKKPELLSSKLSAWGRASESSGRMGCIAGLVKRWVTVEITDFDVNSMVLNCPNGTLHFLKKGAPGNEDGPSRVELRPHDRGDLLTKITACDYDPDAAAPEFQKLVRWAQPKPARRRYLRQWAGYNLTGEMGEQIFHIWWGPTAANGKSTVGNVMRESVGDYGDITNVETFLDDGQKKRGDQATPDIVRLPGVRFLTSGEPGPGSKFNEPLINSVTGGDPMLARDNFRSFFRFSPCFKWTVWCNKKPDIPQGTEGIWRRVKVLLWESHLQPHEKDRDLPNRLKREYAGVLAWMVRGLIDWMDNGFVEPEDVTIQSEAYRDDSDPLASFLRMCTVEEDGARVQSSHLYELFCAWAKAAGEAEWKQKGFSRAMKDRGFDNKQSNGMQWLGLKMIRAVDDFIDGQGKVITIRVDAPEQDGPVREEPPPGDDARDDGDGEAWRERGPPDDDDYVPGF